MTQPDGRSAEHRIVVVGAGYVGLAAAAGFAHWGYLVHVVDVNPVRVDLARRGEVPLGEPDLNDLIVAGIAAGRLTFSTDYCFEGEWDAAFLAVGTSRGDEQAGDLTAIERALVQLHETETKFGAIVVRSTVPVGFADRMQEQYPRLAIVSNPEFLEEGRAIECFLRPDRVVVGVADEHVGALMQSIYAPVAAPVLIVDRRTAELSKLGANAYLATRLSFINELADFADRCGIDIDQVAQLMGHDPRIGSRYFRAGLGFGGSCLPKDLAMLTTMMSEAGVAPRILTAVSDVNGDRVSQMVDRATSAGFAPAGARVTVFGIAFKAGTVDLRNSPGVRLVQRLSDLGAEVRVHDPLVARDAIERAGFVVFPTLEAAAERADALFVTLDGAAAASLNLPALRGAMRGGLLIDGRGAVRRAAALEAGFDYIGLGRPTVRSGSVV